MAFQSSDIDLGMIRSFAQATVRSQSSPAMQRLLASPPPSTRGDLSQKTLHPDELGELCIDDESTDAGHSHSDSDQTETCEDLHTDAEEADHPVMVNSGKATKKRIVKVPWDPFLLRKGDLKGNSEQCACGSVFCPDDKFCFRCGNRRPVEVQPLPLHVEPVPEPAIDDVGERLYAYAAAYRQRKEDLQLLKRENEDHAKKQEHPGRPEISPLSAQLTESLKPISERYKGITWIKEYKLQEEREKKAADAMKEVTSAPKINSKSRNLERSVSSLYRWKRGVDRKTEAKKVRSEELEAADCTFVPQLTNATRKLAREHESRIDDRTVHERLYVDAKSRAFALEAEQAAMAQQFADGVKSGSSRSSSKSGSSHCSSRSCSTSKSRGNSKSRVARSTPALPPTARDVIQGLRTESSPARTGIRASSAVLFTEDTGAQEGSGKKKYRNRRPLCRSVSSTSRTVSEDSDEPTARSVRTGGMNCVQLTADLQELFAATL